jgi:type I restriction enzyme S subunit
MSERPVIWPKGNILSIVNPAKPITYGVVQPGKRLDQGIPIIRGQDYSGGVVDDSNLYLIHPQIAAAYKRSTVQSGDLLFSIVGYLGQTAIVPDHLAGANITQTTARISVQSPNSNSYFLHQFRSEIFSAEVRKYQKGSAQPGLNLADVEKMWVSIPPPDDQSRIADVLDLADGYIAKTEAVIAKLRQVRTGLIHDLLTCGLDENGHLRDPIAHPEQFKDSPLGSIPCDWDVLQLRDTIERVYDYRGRTPLKIGMAWGGGEIPALSANNVEMGQINFSKESHKGSSDLYERWMTQGDTEEGDVLMTMEAPLGNIAQVPDNRRYILSQRVILLRPKTQCFTKDYLALQMAGPRFQKELIRQSSGSTAVGIQRAKLELMHIAVPRRREEQDCAAQIVRLHDKQIRQHEAELIKLQSIKTGLMDDLLTGRVRVPETT